MTPPPMLRARTSRQRYQQFVEDYRRRRLDDVAEREGRTGNPPGPASGRRREYVRAYLRWIRPHRSALAFVFLLALVAAGLEMVEPLFMRFIVDKVLLAPHLTDAQRYSRLNGAGALFLGLIIASRLLGTLKDYRQRLLNTKAMLSLRRGLFARLLHLPLSTLWGMKTGGILSRLTGDVDTTTGLMQMAIVSPTVSIIRLIIAVVVLMALNWRLALTALAIIP